MPFALRQGYDVWLSKPSITLLDDLMQVEEIGMDTCQELTSGREWLTGESARSGRFVGMTRSTGRKIVAKLNSASADMTPYKARVAKTTERAIKAAIGGIS